MLKNFIKDNYVVKHGSLNAAEDSPKPVKMQKVNNNFNNNSMTLKQFKEEAKRTGNYHCARFVNSEVTDKIRYSHKYRVNTLVYMVTEEYDGDGNKAPNKEIFLNDDTPKKKHTFMQYIALL